VPFSCLRSHTHTYEPPSPFATTALPTSRSTQPGKLYKRWCTSRGISGRQRSADNELLLNMSGWNTWSPGVGGYLEGPTPPHTPSSSDVEAASASLAEELEALRRENAKLREASLRSKVESAMLGSENGKAAAGLLQRALRCSAARATTSRRRRAARSIAAVRTQGARSRVLCA